MEERDINLSLWRDLGLDLDRHCELMNLLREVYPAIYMSQQNRPPAMAYFDAVISEIHGDRVRELLEHKKSGGKVIGTFCVYVPDELILAAGAIPVGLCGGAEFSIPDAEADLPRNLCPLIKSFYGFKVGKLCPYFETCDLLVGETTCDGKKKVWECLNEMTPVHVMELPHTKGLKQREMWLDEVKTLKSRLEGLCGTTITEEKLSDAIRLMNEKRKALARLYDLRKRPNPPISGKDALLVSQIAFYDDVERFTRSVNTLADQCEARIESGEGMGDAPRLLVSGCPMAVPNWKLHHIAETSGAVIVAEESCTGTRYFENFVDETPTTMDGMMNVLADRYIATNCACFTPNEGRIDDVIRMVDEYNADGVIHYSLQFCHTYNIEAGRVEKALKERGIPVLRIETDYSMEDVGQLQTRIEALLEQIG